MENEIYPKEVQEEIMISKQQKVKKISQIDKFNKKYGIYKKRDYCLFVCFNNCWIIGRCF